MEINNKWTDKQVRLLKRDYGTVPIAEIEIMIGKSATAIRSKVHYLRNRGFTFDSTRR
jgi:biotin operon repressor